MTAPSKPVPARTRVRIGPALGWLAVDLLLVTAFAATGRTTHASGLALAGVLGTAAPFLAACLISWCASRAWRAPAALWPTGVLVWLGTAIGGLVVRALSGGGMAVSFQVVAVCVLALVLLLPRAVTALVLRRRGSSG